MTYDSSFAFRMMKAVYDENNKRHAVGVGRFGESGTRYG